METLFLISSHSNCFFFISYKSWFQRGFWNESDVRITWGATLHPVWLQSDISCLFWAWAVGRGPILLVNKRCVMLPLPRTVRRKYQEKRVAPNPLRAPGLQAACTNVQNLQLISLAFQQHYMEAWSTLHWLCQLAWWPSSKARNEIGFSLIVFVLK